MSGKERRKKRKNEWRASLTGRKSKKTTAEEKRLKEAAEKRFQEAEEERLKNSEEKRFQEAEEKRFQEAEEERLKNSEEKRLKEAAAANDIKRDWAEIDDMFLVSSWERCCGLKKSSEQSAEGETMDAAEENSCDSSDEVDFFSLEDRRRPINMVVQNLDDRKIRIVRAYEERETETIIDSQNMTEPTEKQKMVKKIAKKDMGRKYKETKKEAKHFKKLCKHIEEYLSSVPMPDKENYEEIYISNVNELLEVSARCVGESSTSGTNEVQKLSSPELIIAIQKMLSDSIRKIYGSALDFYKTQINESDETKNNFLEEINKYCDEYFVNFLKCTMTESYIYDNMFKRFVKQLKNSCENKSETFSKIHPYLLLVIFSNYPKASPLMLSKFLTICQVIFSANFKYSYSKPYLQNLRNFLHYCMFDVYPNSDVNDEQHLFRKEAAKFYVDIIEKYTPMQKENVIILLKRVIMNKKSNFSACYGALCALQYIGASLETELIPEIFPSIVNLLESSNYLPTKNLFPLDIEKCKENENFRNVKCISETYPLRRIFGSQLSPTENRSEVNSENNFQVFSEDDLEHNALNKSPLQNEIEIEQNSTIGHSLPHEYNFVDELEYGFPNDVALPYLFKDMPPIPSEIFHENNMPLEITAQKQITNSNEDMECNDIDDLTPLYKIANLPFGPFGILPYIPRKQTNEQECITKEISPKIEEMLMYELVSEPPIVDLDEGECSEKRCVTTELEIKYAYLIKEELLQVCSRLTNKFIKHVFKSAKKTCIFPGHRDSISSTTAQMFLDFFGQELKDRIPLEYANETFSFEIDNYMSKLLIDLESRLKIGTLDEQDKVEN